MMNRLNFSIFSPKMGHTEGHNEKRIILNVCDKNGHVIQPVFDQIHNYLDFKMWWIENKVELLYQECPISCNGKRSIAESVFHHLNSFDIENEDEEFEDKFFFYRKSHSLRFSMRGTDIDDVYVGKCISGYEISYYSKKSSWNYLIDLHGFFERLQSS